MLFSLKPISAIKKKDEGEEPFFTDIYGIHNKTPSQRVKIIDKHAKSISKWSKGDEELRRLFEARNNLKASKANKILLIKVDDQIIQIPKEKIRLTSE